MTGLGRPLAALLSSATFLGPAGGFAHAASNHVYIGQAGATNVITVIQTGLDNQVGADAETLLLNQDGRDNTVTITQFGWSNAVATKVHGTPSHAPYKMPAKGINQAGNDNRLMLDQSDDDPSGFNAIEAIYQGATIDFESPSNDLEVTQSAEGGSGVAGHYIGEIVQLNPDTGFAPNVMVVTQTSGGDGIGIGNRIESVRHEGHGNSIAISQSATSNRIETVRQIGASNNQTLTQETGAGNVVVESLQFGVRNGLTVRQSGQSNYLASITQSNAAVAISGNKAELVIVGDDNGGDGLGGPGHFTTIAASVGLTQANVKQLGDDNDLTYTIGADVTGAAPTVLSEHDLFAFNQDGTGNGIIGTTIGSGNEAAVRQVGDDNNLSFAQNGSVNAMAVTMNGQRNRADIDQSGTRNTARVDWAGSDGSNNNNGLRLSFSGLLADAASGNALLSGSIRQRGTGNSLGLTIINGDSNLVAFLQSGTDNAATGTITGGSNQALAIQTGHGNVAGFSQTGSNNHLIIEQ